jgi:hypothetical protein
MFRRLARPLVRLGCTPVNKSVLSRAAGRLGPSTRVEAETGSRLAGLGETLTACMKMRRLSRFSVVFFLQQCETTCKQESLEDSHRSSELSLQMSVHIAADSLSKPARLLASVLIPRHVEPAGRPMAHLDRRLGAEGAAAGSWLMSAACTACRRRRVTLLVLA